MTVLLMLELSLLHEGRKQNTSLAPPSDQIKSVQWQCLQLIYPPGNHTLDRDLIFISERDSFKTLNPSCVHHIAEVTSCCSLMSIFISRCVLNCGSVTDRLLSWTSPSSKSSQSLYVSMALKATRLFDLFTIIFDE